LSRKITGIVDAEKITKEQIGLMMMGHEYEGGISVSEAVKTSKKNL
jgi:hypothetical protein